MDQEDAKILIVDDDPAIRETLRDILEALGHYSVLMAADGHEAMECLKSKEVDIVLTDIHMPRMDGIELLAKIKEFSPLLPVVVITGFPTIEIAITAMKKGASDFITKPFKVEQVELIIRKMLRERRLLLENSALNKELEQKRKIEDLNRDLNKKIRELSILYSISEAFNVNPLDSNRLFEQIVEMASTITDARKVSLMLMDHETKRLVLKSSFGRAPVVPGKLSIPLGEGVPGKVALEGRPLLVSDEDPKGVPGGASSLISVPLLIKGEVFAVLNVSDKAEGRSFSEEDVSLLSTLAKRAALSIENSALYESIYNNLIDTLLSLVSTIEAKDPYTKKHSQRVTQLAAEIASHMGLPREDLDTIKFAGYLHDIGKIGIRDSILMKPSRLTEEEYAIIKTHPSIGENIVKPLGLLPKEKALIRHHHERWDGRGYPDGLKGKEIPILARILAVADAFDAMTTSRVYRRAKSLEEAVEEMRRCSETQFDPEVVEVFLKLLESKNQNGSSESLYSSLSQGS